MLSSRYVTEPNVFYFSTSICCYVGVRFCDRIAKNAWQQFLVNTTWLIAQVNHYITPNNCKRSAGQTNLISAQTLRQDHDNLGFGSHPAGMPVTYHIVTVKYLDTSSMMSRTGVVNPHFMVVKSMEDWTAFIGYDEKTGHSPMHGGLIPYITASLIGGPPRQHLTRTRIL